MSILDDVIQQVQLHNAKFIEEIGKKRGNPIIPLFVNPINRSTVDNIFNMIKSPDFTKRRKDCVNPDNIDIIIDSGGGDADAAYHIAKLIHKNFKGQITYIVPRFAKSAATLLVCGGNCIMMGPTSELGPLDPQIQQESGEYISAKSVQSTLDLIKRYIKEDLELATVIASRINPLVLGQYESTLKIAKEYQKELLFLRMFEKTDKNNKIVSNIVKKFAEGYTHHGRVIDYEEASGSLLKIDFCDSDDWAPIWNLYMSHTQIIYLIKVMRILERAKELQID